MKLRLTWIPCPWCHGTGTRTVPGDRWDVTGQRCGRCEGAGKIRLVPSHLGVKSVRSMFRL